MSVKDIVIQKLGGDYPLPITESEVDAGIEEAKVEILNYCNIITIPDALRFTHANMVVDYLRWQNQAKTPTAENGSDAGDISLAQVKSLKLGNMDIDLSGGSVSVGTAGSSTNALKSHAPNLDDILLNYRAQLNRYVNPLCGGL